MNTSGEKSVVVPPAPLGTTFTFKLNTKVSLAFAPPNGGPKSKPSATAHRSSPPCDEALLGLQKEERCATSPLITMSG